MTECTSLHILVVEDNDSLREATVSFLQSQGHHVTGLASAEDVDDTPTRDLPDLYLIDVNLPGENGFDLAERIRHSQPSTGVVLITARGQLKDKLEGYKAGADHYLIKPVEQSEMLACIHSLTRRLKSENSSSASNFTLNTQTLLLKGPAGEIALTHGELILLSALNRAAGKKLERWQAMQLIDSKNKGLLPANLEMRISALRKSLTFCGASSNTIRALRGFGYSLNISITIT